MKKAIIGVVAIGVVLSAIIMYSPKSVEYIQGEKEIVEKEVTISELEKRIADAISASSTDIERKAQAAFQEKKLQLEKEIELSVTRQYKKEIEARETTLEKETGAY